MKIYAGLDIDGIAKLFLIDDTGNINLINQNGWIKILDEHNAEPGEMLIVILINDSQLKTLGDK